MTDPILETERLVFHPFTPDDMPLLVELHSDPEVQRYLGGEYGPEGYRQRLVQYVADQARYGVSKWKAFLRDGTFVGRAGLSFWDRTGEFELGYSFKKSFWGQGLATEAARAIADWSFRNTSIVQLHGFTDVENFASRRVLEKIGMEYEGDHDLGYEVLCSLYRLRRP